MLFQPRFANAIAVNKPAGPPPAMSVDGGPSFVRQLAVVLLGVVVVLLLGVVVTPLDV
jgi:hypothetical protein